MLSVENISAGYGEKLVVEDVTMRVHPREIVGLIGPNGSGKTTLLRVISGVLPPARGEVLLQGAPLRKLGKRRLAQVMACLAQDLASDVPLSGHHGAPPQAFAPLMEPAASRIDLTMF